MIEIEDLKKTTEVFASNINTINNNGPLNYLGLQ